MIFLAALPAVEIFLTEEEAVVTFLGDRACTEAGRLLLLGEALMILLLMVVAGIASLEAATCFGPVIMGTAAVVEREVIAGL